MNFNYLLIWIVCLSCFIFIIRVARFSFSNNYGWIIICSLILAITLILLYLVPTNTGLISAILWLIFLVLPLIGFTKVNKLVYQQNYYKASKLAAYLRWLHPFDGWFEQHQLLLALEMGKRGNITAANNIIKSLKFANLNRNYHAKSLIYWMKADWSAGLFWIRNNIPESILFKHNNLLVYYLRALGETDDLNSLLSSLEDCKRSLEKTGNKITLNLVRMFALAFCGQIEEVEQLFNGSLAIYSQDIRQFWIATAQKAANQEKVAREKLLALQNSNDFILSNAIDWRLSQPVVKLDKVLTNTSWRIIYHLQIELKQEVKHKSIINFSYSKAYATYGLICLNLVFFYLEMLIGSSENINTLNYLGALVPQAVFSGQWWRLLTANFLHFGWVHLFTNMLGLYFLGSFVELTLGKVRYLLAYFVSGVGAMLAFALLAIQFGTQDQLLVGASAAIMGLIGVISALALWNWRKERSHITARRLRFVILIIILQFTFDLITPQVSSLSHLLGLILGFITANFLLLIK